VTRLLSVPEITVKDQCPDDDRELLELMQAGEEQAFLALYRKYQPSLFRFCLHLGGSRHVAEDVTQETFVTLIRRPGKYDAERGGLLLYLFGIARRLVWARRRRQRRADELFTSLEERPEDFTITGPDLLSHLTHNEQLQQVRDAVLALPRKYREVIALCTLQELSYEQAAEVVGCSIGTIRSRMHRAKKILSQKLIEGVFRKTVRRGSSLRYES
jgi:RNA polymerase sigma-70 factor, ECF subfamily